MGSSNISDEGARPGSRPVRGFEAYLVPMQEVSPSADGFDRVLGAIEADIKALDNADTMKKLEQVNKKEAEDAVRVRDAAREAVRKIRGLLAPVRMCYELTPLPDPKPADTATTASRNQAIKKVDTSGKLHPDVSKTMKKNANVGP